METVWMVPVLVYLCYNTINSLSKNPTAMKDYGAHMATLVIIGTGNNHRKLRWWADSLPEGQTQTHISPVHPTIGRDRVAKSLLL